MAKDDKKKGEAPIRFDIPTGWKAIQYGRVPTPVNQPNWKYKRLDVNKQSLGSWVFASLFLAFSVFILILGISESSVTGIIGGALLSIPIGLFLVQRIKMSRTEKLREEKRKGNKKF